jgi:membrane protein EpsK
MLAIAVAGVLAPIIIAQHARGEEAEMTRLSRRSVKLIGLAMALPIGVVAGLAKPLLTVWLGEDFADLAGLLAVLVLHLCVNTAVLPLLSTQAALDKVRLPALVTLAMGLLNFVLAWWWAPLFANGLGVALAGALVLTLKNGLFTPLYGAHIQGLPWHTFLTCLLPGALATGLVFAASLLLSNRFELESWLTLILAGGAIGLVYAGASYFLALDESDRRLVRRYLPSRARYS